MLRHLLLSASAAGLMFSLAGCKHKCCSSDGTSGPPRPFLPPGPGNTLPPPGVPVPPGRGAPPPPEVGPSISGGPAPEILLPDPIAPGGTSTKKSSNGILGGPVNGPTMLAATLEPPVALKP